MKKTILSDKAPHPVGPYSPAVSIGEFIYSSGQVGINADGKFTSEDVKGQTKQALENLKNILEDNGSSLDDIVKVTVFLRDMEDFTEMNDIYSRYFTKPYPARSTVAVNGLPLNARVEIEVIAYKK